MEHLKISILGKIPWLERDFSVMQRPFGRLVAQYGKVMRIN